MQRWGCLNNNRDVYSRIDFSNKDTLKQLMYSRASFESTGYASRASAFDRNEPSNNLYTDIMIVYMDLDRLIEESDLTKRNMRLINLVMSGYTISYIYENFENYDENATIKMFGRILDKIAMTHSNKEVRKT